MSEHPAVKAVLAVTPIIDKVYGKTVTDFDGVLYEAAPIAAKQAAEVMRWLARDWDGDGCKCWRCVLDLADEIDPPAHTSQGDTQ